MKNGLDTLLVPSLRKTIEKNLGKKTLNKIEQRLIERHGMSIACCRNTCKYCRRCLVLLFRSI